MTAKYKIFATVTYHFLDINIVYSMPKVIDVNVKVQYVCKQRIHK